QRLSFVDFPSLLNANDFYCIALRIDRAQARQRALHSIRSDFRLLRFQFFLHLFDDQREQHNVTPALLAVKKEKAEAGLCANAWSQAENSGLPGRRRPTAAVANQNPVFCISYTVQ